MRLWALCLICLLWLSSCSEQKTAADPWVNLCEDLTWLDSIKGSITQNGWQAEIYLTHYQDKRVFEVNACLSCADFPTTVHDCAGTVICTFGGLSGENTCPDYGPAAEDKLLYWKTD